LAAALSQFGCAEAPPDVTETMPARRSVQDVHAMFGQAAEMRLRPAFDQAGMPFPPQQIALLAFKSEKRLELWAKSNNRWVMVKPYPIFAASGAPGPKLEEGDRQVPEGIYRIEYLNPNSNFHLSMKINYPNFDDMERAWDDGRTNLGGQIFIHGSAVSIGCIAVGNRAIEELFTLVDRVGAERVQVVIAPKDFRRSPVGPIYEWQPYWVPDLYANISTALRQYPVDGGLQANAAPVAAAMPSTPAPTPLE
jgi:murein L,D-transpeptidase YafK